MFLGELDPPAAVRPARRRLPVNVRSQLDNRLEAAIRAGLIDLLVDNKPVEEMTLTQGELELLLAILTDGDTTLCEDNEARQSEKISKSLSPNCTKLRARN